MCFDLSVWPIKLSKPEFSVKKSPLWTPYQLVRSWLMISFRIGVGAVRHVSYGVPPKIKTYFEVSMMLQDVASY